jgi:cysteinyl-tRNA synthetase
MSPAPDPSKPIFVHNTLTRQREELVPLVPGHIGMYNCGPTVYDYFHVGNARNFVCADAIRRYLAWRGYTVKFVQNITDIDDKIINRAREAGCSAAELAEKFTKVFFESSEKLGVRPADHHPRATQYVGKMIGFMKRLEKAGYTYTVEGDLYFRVRRFEGYGKLSGRRLDDMQAGARVEVSDKKEDPADFVLWKAAKEGEPSWPSPWGPGRPGWHSECCVMSSDLLGEAFDIHMGGIDLVFPHHENEIAQNQALLGKPFVRYWLHNGFLNVNGEKMSKSLGNFFTIDQVLAKFEAPVVRYFLLSAHYRVPLDFSDGALSEAAVALGRLREARRTARRLTAGQGPLEASSKHVAQPPSPVVAQSPSAVVAQSPSAVEPLAPGKSTVEGSTAEGGCATFSAAVDPLPESVRDIYVTFQTAMDDDFNTPRALAALFEASTRINQCANRAAASEKSGGALDEADACTAALLGQALDELGGEVLGLVLEAPAAQIEGFAPGLRELLAAVRAEAVATPSPAASVASAVSAASTPSKAAADALHAALGDAEADGSAPADALLTRLIAARAAARKARQFALGDRIRDGLSGLGLELLDRPNGTEWRLRG